MQEQKRQKMNTGEILRKFLPVDCVDRILDDADYHKFETMEYWKDISKQPKLNRFPVKKISDIGCWEGWIGDKLWNSKYIISLCHNCASPCYIYNDKISISTNELGFNDWCSQRCFTDGESWNYAKYEKMKYKYEYDD
jgi:hypothetical protein